MNGRKMKIDDVYVICDDTINTEKSKSNGVLYYRVFIKLDTCNYLEVNGCSKGGCYCNITNKFNDHVITLLNVPYSIKQVFDKLNDICEGLAITYSLYDIVIKYLTVNLKNTEFEFSESDMKKYENK